MFKKILFIIFFLYFSSCQHVNDINGYPDPGNAWVTIDDQQFFGKAYISFERGGHFFYNFIILECNDSTRIRIQSEEFREGVISCNPYCGFNLSLMLNDTLFYMENMGTLHFTKVDSSQMIGEFKATVYNAASSCIDCPVTIKKCQAVFNAVKL